MTDTAVAPRATDQLDDVPRRFRVFVDTTTQCNLRCRHCWHDAVRAKGYVFANELMSLELFARISEQFRGRCVSFALSCGFEPLLNPRFAEYVALAVAAGHPDTHFYTNGMLLTPAVARDLAQARPARIVFSLEGADQESFGAIRRNAQLRRLLDAVDLLRTAGCDRRPGAPALEFSWVLMPSNVAQLPALAELAARHGCSRVILVPHVRWAGAGLQAPSLAELDSGELRRRVAEFKARCAAANVAVEDAMIADLFPATDTRQPTGKVLRRAVGLARRLTGRGRARHATPAAMPSCLQPWEIVSINPSGRFTPCFGELIDEIPGNFATQTLEEIWNGEAFRGLRASLMAPAATARPRGGSGPSPEPEHATPLGREAFLARCLRCQHYAPNAALRRAESFFAPRDVDVERLRKVIPSIAPRAPRR